MTTSATTISLLDLDDYCLEHIGKFLPLMDKANIGRTCSRVRNVINHLIASIEVNFNNIYETQTFEIAKNFFTDYGPQVKKIFMQFDAVEEMVEFYYLVPKNCPNIEKIHYNFPYYVDTEIMEMMFESSKGIKYLFCNARELIDSHSLLISKLQDLEILNIEANRDVTGLHLNKLKKLKDLNLQECSGLDPKNFIEICKSNKLRKLSIVECELLDDEAFKTLVETQTELQEIKVTHCYPEGDVSIVALLENIHRIGIQYLCRRPGKKTNLLKLLAQNKYSSLQVLEILRPYDLNSSEREHILKLTNLTEIAFVADADLQDEFLVKLSNSCPKLKRVDLSESTNISNEGIISLAKNLKCLVDLDLRRCSQFGEDLFQNLVEIKKVQADAEKLNVFAWGTKMSEFELKKYEGYTQKRKFVELLFYFKY